MMRTTLAAVVLGLGAVLAGPAGSTARAETPREAWLENHPRIAAGVWAEDHPYRSGLLPYATPVERVVVDPVVPVVPVVVDPVVRVYHPFRRWYR